ncbi:unnamed protein product [marine sediment metagenome]|uniref:EngC GTPase domain-containing protein n=1 Tax=marine sediment metagenome TaxID=412755 RepID=X1SN67_9ZZZZ
MKLEKLGLGDWFKDKIDPTKLIEYRIARVVTVNKDSYIIRNEKKDVFAEVTGKFIFNADSPLDYPIVGDWVYAKYFNQDSFAVISEIFPRETTLKRKTSGKKIEFQLIAANIETAFIVQSLDYNYNLRRLERYLAMTKKSVRLFQTPITVNVLWFYLAVKFFRPNFCHFFPFLIIIFPGSYKGRAFGTG